MKRARLEQLLFAVGGANKPTYRLTYGCGHSLWLSQRGHEMYRRVFEAGECSQCRKCQEKHAYKLINAYA